MTAHWGVPDPAAVEGSDETKRLAFARAYNQLYNRIQIFTALPVVSLDKIALKKELDAIGKRVD
jgi:arsenate reductase